MRNNFFINDLILENDQARLDSLAEEHYEMLSLVAQHKVLWQFTSAKVNSDYDFKKYFFKRYQEKKWQLLPICYI